MASTNTWRACTRIGLSAVLGLGLIASTAVPLNAAETPLRGQDPDLRTAHAAAGTLPQYAKGAGHHTGLRQVQGSRRL